MKYIFSILLFAFVLSVKSQAPSCSGATSITVNGACLTSLTINDGAIEAPGSSCSGITVEGWFTFTASYSQTYTISATNSDSRNLGIQLLSGTCGSLTQVACANDFPGGPATEQIIASITGGNTYYVRLHTTAGGIPMTISSFCITAPPPNDDPCNAIPLVNDCSFDTYSNVNATNTSGVSNPTCGTYSGKDIWFSAGVPASGKLIIEAKENTLFGQIEMAAYSGPNCSTLTLIKCQSSIICSHSSLILNLFGRTPGETIWLRMWEAGGDQSGTIDLKLCNPSISNISPTSANKGQTLTVTATGVNTDFTTATCSLVGKIYNGTDSITGSLISAPTETTSNFSFTIPCSLPSGVYNFKPIDPIHGSMVLASSFTINPSVDASLISTTNLNCNGIPTGSIQVDAIGGSPPYNVSWTGASSGNPAGNEIAASGGTYTLSNLGAGSYTITVTPSVGCTDVVNATVTQPSVLSNTINSFQAPTCFGGNNGTMTVQGSDGTPPYNVSWTGASSGNPGGTEIAASGGSYTMTGLIPGTYNVTITDANGCSALDSDVLLDNPDISSNLTVTTTPSCHDSQNGVVNISVSNGNPPYNVFWSGPTSGNPVGNEILTSGGSFNLTNMDGGLYNITVVDNSGCMHYNSITVSEPSALATSSSQTPTFCPSSFNGTITITANGGTAPYNVSWSGSSSGNPAGNEITNSGGNFTITSLGGGSYTITIIDANGCQQTEFETLDFPIPLNVNPTMTPTSCSNSSDGAETLTVSGGEIPYNISWSGPSSGNPAGNEITTNGGSFNITGLSAGNYTATITDNLGCSTNSNFTITSPSLPTITTSVNNVSCNNPGSIEVTVTGGIAPYNVGWSGPTNGNPAGIEIALAGGMFNAQGMNQGMYTIMVTDANGCSNNTAVMVQDDGNLFVTSNVTNPTCPGFNDGAITTTVFGGSGNFSYTWNNGSTASDLTGLLAGNYAVIINDNAGCDTTLQFQVMNPTPMDININITQPDCGDNNGFATASVSNGASPYNYQWSNGSLTSNADSLSAGIYMLTVTDDNGCTASENFGINNLNGMTLSSTSTDVTCPGNSDGTIDLIVSGGVAPYTYNWSNGATTQDLNSLNAGGYMVQVEDDNGCSAVLTDVVGVNPIDLTDFAIVEPTCSQNDGSISVNVTGGEAPYTFQWSPNVSTSNIANNLSVGGYFLTVTDANGCEETKLYTLSNPGGPVLEVTSVSPALCDGTGGDINISILSGNPGYTYLWGTGETTEDLSLKPQGEYDLTVTDTNGCASTINATVPGVTLNPISLCLTTVDEATNQIICIWQKPVGLRLSHINIYRENAIAGQFDFMFRRSIDSTSQWMDPSADAFTRGWRYKLTYVDSCGNESPFGIQHKTIHLVSNLGIGNVVNLIWDDYEGFAIPTFYINRYHPSTGWEVIDSLPSNMNSYTDNFPPNGNVVYAITVKAPQNCDPSRAGVNTSRSNIKNQPVMAPNGIIENEISFNLYPNPANTQLYVSIENYSGGSFELKIMNAIGEVVKDLTLNQTTQTIDVKELPSGLYTVKISSEKSQWVKKLIIQK